MRFSGLARTKARLLLGFTLLAAVSGLSGAAYARHEMAVTGRLTAAVSLTETAATNFTGVTGTVTPGITFSQTYTAGTGTGAIDKKWCDRRTIAASGADTLDLAGVLLNEFGTAQTFAKVKAIMVSAATANTNDVWVGGGATNRFNTFLKDSSVVIVRPGYFTAVGGGGTGYVVTAATADKLLVKNSAGTTSVTYDICVAGTST